MVVTFILPEFAAAPQTLIGLARCAAFEQMHGLAERRGVTFCVLRLVVRHIHQQMDVIGHNAESQQAIVNAVEPMNFVHDDLGDDWLTQPVGAVRQAVEPLVVAAKILLLEFVAQD